MDKILNQNNNRNKVNQFFNTNLDATINDRYCTKCHVKLVHNPKNRIYDKYVYSCPVCNCGPVNIHNTEPSEKLIANFPTVDITRASSSKQLSVAQPQKDRLSRSEYFIQKNIQQKKQEIEDNDPYLALLKKTNLKITNVDYRDPLVDEYNEY